MKKPLRTLRVENLKSNLLNRIVGIAKRLHKTVESRLNALIYRLLDLPDDIYLNGGIQIPSPSISREEIDKLLFEAQERNLAFEAQIKSFNAEIDDFQRVIEECTRGYGHVHMLRESHSRIVRPSHLEGERVSTEKL